MTRAVGAVATLMLASATLAAQKKPSLDIHYVPTPPEVVQAMLDLAQVDASDVVYDLGSGDGRIVIAAAQRGARARGVELDASLNREARAQANARGVADRVRFVEEDIFKVSLADASVVMLYLSPTTNLRLRDKLRRELRPGARIVSHRFDMGDWPPDEERTVGEATRIFLWHVRPN